MFNKKLKEEIEKLKDDVRWLNDRIENRDERIEMYHDRLGSCRTELGVLERKLEQSENRHKCLKGKYDKEIYMVRDSIVLYKELEEANTKLKNDLYDLCLPANGNDYLDFYCKPTEWVSKICEELGSCKDELKEANAKIKEYEEIIRYSKIENCCKVESLHTSELGVVQVELWLRKEANDKFTLDEYIDFAHSHALKHSISEKTLVRNKHTVSQEDDCICVTF